MSNRLGGKQGTAYVGTNANNPPNITYNDRDPNQYDTQNYVIGDEWINTVTKVPWKLVSLEGNSTSKGELAEWLQFGTGTVKTLTGNSGGAVPPDVVGNINVVGDGTTITAVGVPGTNTITLSTVNIFPPSFPADVGTATPSLGVLNIFGNPTSLLSTTGAGNTITTNLVNGTNGQVIIGGGANAAWANITSSNGSITITNGANTIDITTIIPAINVQVFTVSDTYTPTAGMTYCTIEVVGGGGGGGGAAATSAGQYTIGDGGGGGGYARKTVNAATIGVSQVVTIGAAGVASAAGAASGGTGGTTSVGAIVSATGGSGGLGGGITAFITSNVTAGGLGSGGDINLMGSYSLVGFIHPTTGNPSPSFSAAGGASFYSSGSGQFSIPSGTGVSAPKTGLDYGGGGGGALNVGDAQAAAAGAAGAPGIVIITEYIN